MKNVSVGEFVKQHEHLLNGENPEAVYNQFLADNGTLVRPEFSIKEDDRKVLAILMRKFNPKTVVETGTNDGGATVLMALNSDAYFYTIDMGTKYGYPEQGVPAQIDSDAQGRAFRNTRLSHRITVINESTFNIRATEFPPANMWFVDSDHSYKTVEHETNLAIENMFHDGGVIVYHDARKGLPYESDVYKFLEERGIDATVVETRSGIAYVEIPPAQKITVKETYNAEEAKVAHDTFAKMKEDKPSEDVGVVGLMMTKNEADIVGRVLKKWKEWNIPIIAVDGSDDGTYDILKSHTNVTLYRDEELFGKGVKGSLDWVYQLLLDKKRDKYGPGGYCCIAAGDEVWLHNPLKIAGAMTREMATYAHGYSMQFFLHTTDMEEWSFPLGRWKKPMPPADRLKWYSPGWEEARIFFDDGICKYRPMQGFDTLPDGIRKKRLSRNFIYSHYPMRDPIQILSRAKDRVERDYQPFYNHSYNKDVASVFYSTFPGIEGALKYDGSFGDYEKHVTDWL